jgi:predicted transcriptional regulator
MNTQTVRISETDHMALSELSKKSGRTMSAVLSDAIQELARKRLLLDTNDAYARLRGDARAWREETEERALWDGTPADEAG